MRIYFKVIFPLAILFFSWNGYGGEVNLSELYEADDYFDPSASNTNFDTQIRGEVGFIMPQMDLELPPTRTGTIVTPGRGDGRRPPTPRNKPEQQTTQQQQQQQGYTSPPANNNTSDQNTDGNNNNTASTNAGGSGGGTGLGSNGNSAPEIEAGSGNVANVKAGLLYAEDDSSADYEAEEAVPGKQASAMNRRPAAVALNNRNSGGNRNDDDDGGSNPSAPGRPGGSGVGNANMGTFQSGGGQQPNAKPGGEQPGGDGYLKKLSNIASNMGERFFGLGSGGSSSGNGSRSGGAGFNKGKSGKNNIKTASAKGVDPNMRDLLKRGLDQYTRGVASRLELGGKKGQVFGGMCNHYARYARQHRIPNDRVDCSEF